MMLFLSKGDSCPHCKMIESSVDLSKIKGLTLRYIPLTNVLEDEEDVDALADADFFDIQTAPTLIDDGMEVIDTFEIIKLLKEASDGA